MDSILNTAISASVSLRQVPIHKDEGSSVRPRADNHTSNQSGQPGQVNHATQTNQVSFVSSLVTATNTLEAQKVNIDKISATNKLSVVSNNEQRPEEDTQETAQSFFETDASRAANAYQAAGAAHDVGIVDGNAGENSSGNDGGTVIFSPENISPIDIQV